MTFNEMSENLSKIVSGIYGDILVAVDIKHFKSPKLHREHNEFKRQFSRKSSVYFCLTKYLSSDLTPTIVWVATRFDTTFYKDIINILSFANYLAYEYSVSIHDIEFHIDAQHEILMIGLHFPNVKEIPYKVLKLVG